MSYFSICVILGLSALATIGLVLLRHEIAALWERWLSLGRPAQCVTILSLTIAVLYGGTKAPSSTNEPPDDASSSTNAPMMLCFSPRPMMLPPPEPTNQITNWTARGAYCDWQPVTFSDGFQFPVGTNFIDGVTLFAYGELKSNLHCSPSTFTYSLPTRVSIEPNVSSVTHGLTPSNSYLFSWHNCCANRSARNRVDASIELFDSGEIVTRFGEETISLPPLRPEGFVGHGQDDAWLAASFSSHYDAITNLGYDAWLDDYIGHNEPNGRYQVKVTVAALPEHGPCYLYCGPYKTVVTAPGTYCFPLEVFEEYRAYTVPERVPLSFEYDDGYDYPTQPLMAGAPLMAPRSVPDYYIICRVPDVVIVPSHIPISRAIGSRIGLLCNVPNVTWRVYSSFANGLSMNFLSPSEAEIETVLEAGLVELELESRGHRSYGTFYIDPAEPWPDPAVTNGWDFGESTNVVDETSSTNSTSSAENP